LSPAPGALLPSIRIGKTTVTEGDGGDPMARLPYTVVGDVTVPARFAVAMEQRTFCDACARIGWSPKRYAIITVAPGDTGSVIEVPYEADNLDDRRRQVQRVMAVPLTGLAMSDYIGRVVVRDDDPTPRLSFDVRRQRVGYGDDLVFVTRLAARVDYDAYARLSGLVFDRVDPLRVVDVPKRWARRHIVDRAPRRSALAKWITRESASIDAGELSTTFVVPTRVHPPHPNSKSLTLRLRSPLLDHPIRATIRVR